MSLKKKKVSKYIIDNIKISSDSERKKKTENVNMIVSNIEIFVKKKKKRSVSIIVNVIKIFLRNKSERKLSI